MTAAEILTGEVGGFALAAEVIYLGFVAVKRNYVKGSLSLGVTAPDGRYLKPPKVVAQPADEPAEPVTEPAAEPVPIAEGRPGRAVA